MRHLTGDYTAPETACNTYRALLQALQELDLHRHIHLENSILFPRAVSPEDEAPAAQVLRPGLLAVGAVRSIRPP
jgi:regulator of cell morphogenesis and NO signaling